MKWSVDYSVERRNGEIYCKRRIEDAKDITAALQSAKKGLLRELIEADGDITEQFIYAVDMMLDPEEIVTVEEVEDED